MALDMCKKPSEESTYCTRCCSASWPLETLDGSKTFPETCTNTWPTCVNEQIEVVEISFFKESLFKSYLFKLLLAQKLGQKLIALPSEMYQGGMRYISHQSSINTTAVGREGTCWAARKQMVLMYVTPDHRPQTEILKVGSLEWNRWAIETTYR